MVYYYQRKKEGNAGICLLLERESFKREHEVSLVGIAIRLKQVCGNGKRDASVEELVFYL